MHEGSLHYAFMQDDDAQNSELERAQQLHAVVDQMLAPFGKKSPRGTGLMSGFYPPFDIAKPNQHDTKAEFQNEMNAVSESIGHIDGLLNHLSGGGSRETHNSMLARLGPIMDQKLAARAPKGRINDSIEMIRKNVADAGGFTTSLYVLVDLFAVLMDRKQELEDQKEQFWNLSHRAPDYYARAIALRLAKLYAREAGRRPTTGTSGVTGEPSTNFARALSDVFEILEIQCGVRSYAEWAISQLTDEDLAPPEYKLGTLARLGPPPDQKSARDAVVQALIKRHDK